MDSQRFCRKLPVVKLIIVAFITFSTTTVFATVPSAPTGVLASNGTSSSHVIISWNLVFGADDYEIYRSEYSSGPYNKIGQISNPFSSYNDIFAVSTVTPPSITSTTNNLTGKIDVTYSAGSVTNKTYYYKVKAKNTSGTSGFSNSDSGWINDSLSYVNVHVSNSQSTGYSLLAQFQSNSGTYSHTGLGNDITKWYKLEAVTTAGFPSALSTAASGKTLHGIITSASISGPSSIEADTDETWTGSASGGLSPYTNWKWEVRYSSSWSIEQNGSNNNFDFAASSDFDLRVTVTDSDSQTKTSSVFSVTVTGGGGEKAASGVPRDFGLEQNYPNPFNPSTEIRYSIPNASHVTLIVYTLTGKEVARLVDRQQSAGTYTTKFDARNFASGVYLYRITAGSFSEVKRMAVIK